MKITAAYLEQNRILHAGGSYGLGGQRWVDSVRGVCEKVGSRDVLDYGCGQRTLERALGFAIRNYDPCIAGLDATPQPADIVVCTDVLEHIEPDCLDEVLDDLKRVVRRAGFLVIANRPAKKTLPDGRNAHLIQEGIDWWRPKLAARFHVAYVRDMNGEFVVIVEPLAG